MRFLWRCFPKAHKWPVRPLSLLLMQGAALAGAQALAVQPVTLQLAPGQKAATLLISNRSTTESAVQTRAFRWTQQSGTDEIIPSDDVLISPPIAVIPPGGTQLVRLVLRHSPTTREATYRVLLDQIPPPPVAGVVHVVLRLSIPIFAQPLSTAVPRVKFHVESTAGKLWLVAENTGIRHDRIREVTLSAADGSVLKTSTAASPYVLAGATRKWLAEWPNADFAAGQQLHLTARSERGTAEQQVSLERLP